MLYFRLASLAGCASVDEFLARTTSHQLAEWRAYTRVEPLWNERLEILLATIAAVLANQWRGENDEPASPRDFMWWLPNGDIQDEPPDMVAVIEQLNAAFGGEDLRDVSQETHPS